jgi:hypothetical protein
MSDRSSQTPKRFPRVENETQNELAGSASIRDIAISRIDTVSIRYRFLTYRSRAWNEVYVAGLWIRDIHHGLLWEEHHIAAPCTSQAEEAPSWSWASFIALVRWPGRSKGAKGTFRVTGICFKRQRRHDIPDHLIFDGCRLRPLNAMTEQPIFDPTNMFSWRIALLSINKSHDFGKGHPLPRYG